MKQLFTVSFRLKTDKYPSFTESCEQTVFADSYDDAVGQVTAIFGGFKGFSTGIVKPIGVPMKNVTSMPITPEERIFES